MNNNMQNLEIERKFLIERPDLKSIDRYIISKSHIIQTYLKRKDENIERRVRKKVIGGKAYYYYTEKEPVSSITRKENERLIQEDEYKLLLSESISVIEKYRYIFLFEGKRFEIDIYPSHKDITVVEIELESEDEKLLFLIGLVLLKK